MNSFLARPWAALAGAFLLVVAVLLVYLPGLHGGFVFDDFPNILQNPSLRGVHGWHEWLAAALSSPSRELPRPLAMLSFAINVHFTGLDPAPFKAVNIAIHALNAMLALALALRLFAAEGSAKLPLAAALVAAGAWALHPINVTAVLLIVQRMEILSHVFVFCGLLAYCAIRTRQASRPGGWVALYSAMIGFTTLGILAKESAALLPLYALWLEVCLFGFRSQDGKRKLAVFYALLLALPATLGVAWLLPKALAPGAFAYRDFNLVERLLTEPRVLMSYLRWFLLPDLSTLSFYHDEFPVSRSLANPATTLPAIAALLGIGAGAWLVRRRWPLVALGLFWFLSAHALTGSFIALELVFEHRNYFASFGLAIAAVAAVRQLLVAFVPGKGLATRALACGLGAVLCLAFLTFLRTREWRDPMAFAISEAAKKPDSPRATYSLGWMIANATGYRKDSPVLDPAFDALERARAVRGSGVLADQAILILAARTGRPLRPEWWQHLQQQLRERPVGPQEMAALASLTECQVYHRCAFPAEQMMASFAAALAHGEQPILLNTYANYIYNVAGDEDLGLQLWRRAQALDPTEREYSIAIAKVLMAHGRFDEAQAEIERLRHMGRAGQYERYARQLEERMAKERRARAAE